MKKQYNTKHIRERPPFGMTLDDIRSYFNFRISEKVTFVEDSKRYPGTVVLITKWCVFVKCDDSIMRSMSFQAMASSRENGTRIVRCNNGV